MQSTDIAAIRELRIFRDIQDSSLERIIAPSFIQSFPPGTRLIQENQPADFLYILLDGRVEMSASVGTNETVIEILEPVSMFILAAVLNNAICLQAARSITPARVMMIPARLIRDLLFEEPSFMQAVVYELASAYRRTVKELKNQKLRNGTVRLANWLLRENRRQGGTGKLKLSVEKRLLASYLGMTPENLSRGFSALGAHGVQIKASNIVITDMQALEIFAAPDPLIDAEEPHRL